MGLSNTSGGGKKYVTIVKGMWTLRVEEGTEGAQPRELTKGPNAGKTVFEKYYNTLSGMLVGGSINQGQFGSDLCLVLEVEGVEYTLQMPIPSDYFSSFAKCCASLDLDKEVVLGLGRDKQKDQPFMFIKQDGASVRSNYTKDEPNGMPQWEKKEVMGKTTWSHEAQDDFLYNVLTSWLEAMAGEEDIPF